MNHARVVIDLRFRRTECRIDLINLGRVNGKLSFHTYRFEIVELLLQTLRILKLNVWRINRDYTICMATKGEPFTCKIQFFITFTSVNFEVSCEVIGTEGSRYKSVFTSL